jgi:uncharacterized repeat protein (TIGR04138 family)
MPSKRNAKTLQDVVDAVGTYPPEAYLFVQQGLNHTVRNVHGDVAEPDAAHHVGGKELCHGLRELALAQWGLMARTVLARWHITTTLDFGRLVFAMVQFNLLQKTDQDRLDDFENVFDFRTAFETNFKIVPPPALAGEAEDPRKGK